MASRSVLITGASSGIGESLARVFAERGDKVAAVARSVGKLRKLEEEAQRKGKVLYALGCDVRSVADVREMVRRARRRVGHLHVLINNAGVTSFKDFLDTSTAEFDRVVATNLRGMVTVTKTVLPGMIRQRRGLIINVLSYAAKTVYTGSSAYSASKAGGEALMNVLREELRGKKVRVMNVYPGAVLTPIWDAPQRRRHGRLMMNPDHLAEVIYQASVVPSSVVVEEMVLRPHAGDLRI